MYAKKKKKKKKKKEPAGLPAATMYCTGQAVKIDTERASSGLSSASVS